jgi:phosphoenolpyruvate phosphomutase
MKNKIYIILGAVDAISAYYCSKNGADYIWASSFVISTMLGLQDKGMVKIKYMLPLIKSLIKGSSCPVILDLDVGGRNLSEYRSQLDFLKSLSLGGICIEDENYPKVNAMLKTPIRHLIPPEKMALKIKIAKETLDSKWLIIARTHSLIAKEPFSLLQKRVSFYSKAGADILCIHYTGNSWDFYSRIINNLNSLKPLGVILSKINYIPKPLLFNSKIKFFFFPNQIYRLMLKPIFKIKRKNFLKNLKNEEIINVKKIFKIIDEINKNEGNYLLWRNK